MASIGDARTKPGKAGKAGETFRTQSGAWTGVAVSLAAVAFGITWYVTHDGGANRGLATALAGSVQRVAAVVGPGPFQPAQASAQRDALAADTVLGICLSAAVVVAALLGRALFLSPGAQRLSGLAAWAGGLAFLLGVVANVALSTALDCLANLPEGVKADGATVSACTGDSVWAATAQGLTTARLLLLVPSATVALVALLVTLTRLIRSHSTQPALPAVTTSTGGGPVPPSRSAWAEHSVPAGAVDGERLGICVSGGGIRSATVSLGALHILREHRLLGRATYLASVSGGGYAAGAMRLALQEPPPPDGDGSPAAASPDPAAVEDVFAPGSPELDHVRRHGRYLADGPAEWAAALGTVLAGLVVNMVILTLAAVLAGRALGHFLATAELTWLVRGSTAPASAGLDGLVWTLVVAGVVALGSWALSVWRNAGRSTPDKTLDAVVKTAAASVLALAVVAFVIPAVARLSGQLVDWVGDAGRTAGVGSEAVAGGALATLSGYAATLAATLWRHRSTIGGGATTVGKVGAWAKTHGQTTFLQRVFVYAGFAVVLAWLLFVFGVVARGTGTLGHDTGTFWPAVVQEGWLTAGVALVLLFFTTVPDSVRWSLHPFYKRRLATAFAVRRTPGKDGAPAEADPYEFFAEPTALPTYADPRPGFPTLVMSAAAHVSGQAVSPPGRRVVPFTFTHDLVGGPHLGWIHLGEAASVRGTRRGRGGLDDWTSGTIWGNDLSVQGAMAVSGAAFASAMGRHARPFSAFFALTNARLGTWVPNPRYVEHLRRKREETGDAWHLPRLPRKRRTHHLALEILGLHPLDGALLLVTDGGHYENLGLVELLRRRCTTILCVDASGDDPGLAGGLADAVTLAREELGVEIQLEDMDGLAAGSGTFTTERAGLVGKLGPKLARRCVVAGVIRYPALGPDAPATTGLLVVGKATLVPDLPDDLLAYAATHPRFPHDPTSDQWFDHGQFDAYHTLGLYVGRQMVSMYEAVTQRSSNVLIVVQERAST